MKIKSLRQFLRHRAKIHRARHDAPNHLIIVEPFGGLANRMRVIASGLWLKNKVNGNLLVIWVSDECINCPYELIFESNENIKTIRENPCIKHVKETSKATLAANIINKFIGIDYCIKERDFLDLIWPGKLDILAIASSSKVIYIQTCEEFGDNLFAFKSFNPIPQIREQVDRLSRTFTKSTIGIHIRRTDHALSIENSPLPLFIEKMQHEIVVNKETNFFLATDDSAVEKNMFNVFGPKIITHKKEISRQTIKGIQDAAVDLYCLSKTSKIVGSYWSSFSEVASKINQINLEVIQKCTRDPINDRRQPS